MDIFMKNKMKFKIVKGYADLIDVIISNTFLVLFKEKATSYLIVFFYFIRTFITNVLFYLLHSSDFLSYLKFSIKEEKKLFNSYLLHLKTVAKLKFLNDWNSATTKLGKIRISCDYGLKLTLNVILPFADFVTDIYFAVSIYGIDYRFFILSGIFIV